VDDASVQLPPDRGTGGQHKRERVRKELMDRMNWRMVAVWTGVATVATACVFGLALAAGAVGRTFG
jgi:hypothetical protein